MAIRCDNQPELTSRHFLAWCVERQIELLHIQPGKPTQNAHVETSTRQWEYGETRRVGSRRIVRLQNWVVARLTKITQGFQEAHPTVDPEE
jgi:transposase InsO family protein